MLKKLSTIIFTIVIFASLGFSQDQPTKKKAPLIFDPPSIYNGKISTAPGGSNIPLTAANYVAVDTMANSFGPAIAKINPLAYDSLSNVLALVYRGYSSYAIGSGELWWSYSTDMGTTWTRSQTSVQNGLTAQNAGRYPNMTLHNPLQSSQFDSLWAAFSWPELNPAAFGFLGYGVSLGMKESAFAEIDQGPPTYSSSVPTFSDNNYIYWASNNQDDAGVRLFRTQDYSVIEKIDPPQWHDTVFQSNGQYLMGGVAYNGVVYFGANAPFVEAVGAGGWGPGYSKSTDNGATWSDWFVVNWLNIPTTQNFDDLWDYKTDDVNIISTEGDINVDYNGNVHIVVGLTDTANGGRNAIVEFFETSEGVWDVKIIADSIKENPWYYPPDDAGGNPQDPGLGQMGFAPYLAANEARDFFVCQWVQGSPTAGDTLCDIYMKYRKLDGEWSDTTLNLTETDGMNETGAHLAPELAVHEVPNVVRQYYAFSMYWYEAGVTTPLINTVNPSIIYVAPILVYEEALVGVGDINPSAISYQLNQNYPNPFNPNTKITYAIPERGNVSLKVFDILGREVAAIVNTTQDAGTHEVNFDASNLSSGLYIYTLTAGSFSSSKKMMLLK